MQYPGEQQWATLDVTSRPEEAMRGVVIKTWRQGICGEVHHQAPSVERDGQLELTGREARGVNISTSIYLSLLG